MYDVARLVLSGMARYFLDLGVVKKTAYFYEDDVVTDNPVDFPKGKAIRFTIDYVDEEDID